MLYVVVTINPDGTAAVTTPIPLPGESPLDAAVRLERAIGGEVVSQTVVEALYANAVPPAGTLVPAETFRERLLPAYLRIAAVQDAALVAKWDRLIRDFLPPTRTTPVNVANPATAGLVQALAGDKLLTPEEAAAALVP